MFSLLKPFGAALLIVGTAASAYANCEDCAQPSWVFKPSTYSHDPYSGARVAQYQSHDPVEPLDDPRLVTSRYRRVRTNLRGADGSVETTYDVQSWGNGRGGIDAEWERFHDAWQQSYLTGSYYQRTPAPYGGYGYPPAGAYPGYGPGYGQPGYGPGYGYPGYGPGHGHPGPGYGRPVYPHGTFYSPQTFRP